MRQHTVCPQCGEPCEAGQERCRWCGVRLTSEGEVMPLPRRPWPVAVVAAVLVVAGAAALPWAAFMYLCAGLALGTSGWGVWAVCASQVAAPVVAIVLGIFLLRGATWAQWALSGLLLVGLACAPYLIVPKPGLGCAATALAVGLLVLLWTPAARDYFRR